MEHIQEENQEGTTTLLLKILVLQMSVEIEGYPGNFFEGQVEISTIQDEHIKPHKIDTMI